MDDKTRMTFGNKGDKKPYLGMYERNNMRVLIVKLSAIGDVIHTIPFLRTLKLNFPHWEIDWVLEDVTYPLLKHNPLLTKIIEVKRKTWTRIRDMKGLINFILGLRKTSYDLVLDLQGLLKSGLVTLMARANEKLGLSIAREFSHLFYSKVIEVDIERHALLRTLDVARALGAKAISEDASVFLPEGERKAYEMKFSALGLLPHHYLVINPVAKWPSKLWVQQNFATLARRLRQAMGYPVVFTGSKADRAYIQGIIGQDGEGVLDLSGLTTLRELAFLLERAKVMISTDTGPMHLAAAMGCPVVALFGPTSPKRTGPFGSRHVVLRGKADCAPCFKKTCEDGHCMKSIGVDEVIEATKRAANGISFVNSLTTEPVGL